MGRAGSCGWEGLKAGQWEEEKAWGAPNVAEEKRGCHLQEDSPPSPCYAWSLGHPLSLSMLSLHPAAPDRASGHWIKAWRKLLKVLSCQEVLP